MAGVEGGTFYFVLKCWDMPGMNFLKEELDELKKKSLYRKLRILQSPQEPVSVIDGKKVVNLSSNNYLGLATHPRLKKAAISAVEKWGVGAGAVRPIIGTMEIHDQLERELAAFKHTEATLVFVAGIAANRGTIQALVPDEEDAVISDELNHASIIDGIRLTKAKRFVYPHKNLQGLEEALKKARGARRILVVTDGVFSMDGDVAPLPEIVELSHRYGAFVMVDDAHGSGVMGPHGEGTAFHFGLQNKVDVQMATMSKALGVLGGYVAGSMELREFLIHKARPFLFSTAHPPAVAAACLEAIHVLQEEPQHHQRLWENTKFFKTELDRLGFDTAGSVTPITPVIVGDAGLAMKFSDLLFEEGVFAQGIGYPTVPEGKARLRTIVTARHTKEDLEKALHAFAKVGKKLALVPA
jgi:glycine C-acetyltransferase